MNKSGENIQMKNPVAPYSPSKKKKINIFSTVQNTRKAVYSNEARWVDESEDGKEKKKREKNSSHLHDFHPSFLRFTWTVEPDKDQASSSLSGSLWEHNFMSI